MLIATGCDFLQNIIVSAVLAFALLYGGICSTTNALNIRDDSICSQLDNLPNSTPGIDEAQRQCNNAEFEQLRNCQAANAVSSKTFL